MQVSGPRFFAFLGNASLRIRRPEGPAAVPPVQASGASTRDFAKALHGLFDAARDLRLGGSSYRSGVSALGRTARSSGPLGLSATPTPTTLSSYEEANTIPTSYTPSEPDWVGNSNGNPTIGGIYDGSNGDTTLTFTVLVGGRVGQDPILIEVRDGQGGLVDTISMLNEPPDTVFTLSNGLDVSFDNGQIRLNDSFTVDVFNSIPSSIDPFAKFNGAGGDDPNFEPGFEVTSGSFEVNGVVINVGAGDTVMSVIEKITTSGRRRLERSRQLLWRWPPRPGSPSRSRARHETPQSQPVPHRRG